jgi:hypothetical protein
MKNFVQLKDNVVFAHHSSSTEVDIPGDNIIEVDGDVESYLNKKYENDTFIDAPLIKYAVLDESNDNTVVSIKTTYFISEATGPVINNDDVKVLWKFNGESFVPPTSVAPVEIIIAPPSDISDIEEDVFGL